MANTGAECERELEKSKLIQQQKVVLDSTYMFKATLLDVPLFDGDSTAAEQQILV